MSRRYVWVDRAPGRNLWGWVEYEKAPPLPRLAIQGVKEPFKSMADGRYYDDSRTYEREIRARGYEVVGDEQPIPHSQTIPEDNSVRDDLIETAREYGHSIEGRFDD